MGRATTGSSEGVAGVCSEIRKEKFMYNLNVIIEPHLQKWGDNKNWVKRADYFQSSTWGEVEGLKRGKSNLYCKGLKDEALKL